MLVDATVNGAPVEAIVDTGATISAVSRWYVPESAIKKEETLAVAVGSGETLYTLGTTELLLKLGDKVITQKAHVLETKAFQAVLGMDFLNGPFCTGIITHPSPPKLVIEGQLYPLKQSNTPSSYTEFSGCSTKKHTPSRMRLNEKHSKNSGFQEMHSELTFLPTI